MGSFPLVNVECEVSPCGQAGQGTEIPFPPLGSGAADSDQALVANPTGRTLEQEISSFLDSRVEMNQLHRPGMTDELLRGGVGVERSINTCYRGWVVSPCYVECEVSPCGQAGQGTEIPFPPWGVRKKFIRSLGTTERSHVRVFANCILTVFP
ncbi:hypothetical protein TNCV_415971 [Trichonephila clavipes]|nr:hypothetical protein TNCV_415971 [Trichonephila clavipes]